VLAFIECVRGQPGGRTVEQRGNGVPGRQLARLTEPRTRAEHQQQLALVLLAQMLNPYLLLFIQAAAVALCQTKMPWHVAMQVCARGSHC
jgi:hypothetical protein